MKQVIFLSFYCQKYKKTPIIRIYIGDRLLDEIEIPEYTDNTFEELSQNLEQAWKQDAQILTTKYFINNNSQKIHILTPAGREFYSKNTNYVENFFQIKKKFLHPKIFMYVVDNESLILANGSIYIELVNDDTNYNNGFMTKSTLLALHSFYIIPEITIINPIEFTKKYLNIY
jgi:hypothetical protein